jgi:hypothetical protein
MSHSSQFGKSFLQPVLIRFGVDLGEGPPQDLVPQQEGGMLAV